MALAAIMDMTVEEMLRPTPSPEEQLRRAQEALGQTSARVAEARAQYDFAKTRLHKPQNPLAHTSTDDSGDAASPPPANLSAAIHNNNGGSDGLHLAQGQGHAAAG
ncbi:hypothetical protein ACTXG6_18880 [Pseudonocardia sp. Cha107L01]|uniref:hypothetical protein n=1 Tax=Pseudonocardia sp. Cha107L01 TaxID=3457576 RepID=UPI00403EC1A1